MNFDSTQMFFSRESQKKASSDKNKKSGFVVNKQARAVEEDEIPKKKSSKKAAPPAPKVLVTLFASKSKISRILRTFARWYPRSQQRRRQYQKGAQARLQRARSISTQRANLKWTIRWVSPWPSWPRRSRRARRRRRRKVQSLRRRNWSRLRDSRKQRRHQEANLLQQKQPRCSVAVEVKTRTHHSSGLVGFHVFLERCSSIFGIHLKFWLEFFISEFPERFFGFLSILSLSRDLSGSHSKSKKSPSPPTLLPQKSKVIIFRISKNNKQSV